MLSWLRDLDALLRGQKTMAADLVAGRLRLSLRTFVPLAVLLGASYGFFMGWFAVFIRQPPNYQQLIASTVKLPALFLLTLVVTFPSLYVFNALVGCRLTWGTTLRLLVGAVVVNLAVATSFAPILGFFTFSTTSYPFMILLNVMLLALAGVVGLTFLMQVLRRTVRWQAPLPPASAPPANGSAGPDHVPVAQPMAPPSEEALGGQDKTLERYLRPDLVIIDDMGMKQLPKRSGEYLFEIIMRRYQVRSTMMTSNRPLEDWGKLIGDVPAATAILDRFLHNAEVITITGRSYRLKDRAAKTATPNAREDNNEPACTAAEK